MSEEADNPEISNPTAPVSDQETKLRNKRKQLRSKITRTITKLNNVIDQGEETPRRIKRILEEIKTDYFEASQVHCELYDFVDESQEVRLNQWESNLSNDVYDVEEKVEDYLNSLNEGTPSTRASVMMAATTKPGNLPECEPNENNHSEHVETNLNPPLQEDSIHSEQSIPISYPAAISSPITIPLQPDSFDNWIDKLIDYKETDLSQNMKEMSISEALYKLEASKDIPTISLDKYDGSPLGYVDFVEKFKIHIHNKPHLNDGVRMLQLQMHLTGNAARAISGLGSSGIMYATAIKCLKEQFGQRSSIARACMHKLTSGKRLASRDRQGLRDFSLDIVNCISVFQRIGYYSDVNSSEALRQIISRLPDHMTGAWKNVASDIRVSGQIPTIVQVSDFIRRRVRAEFDPDFGDINVEPSKYESKGRWDKKKGVYSTHMKREVKCYMCEEAHRVTECPAFKDYTVRERVKFVEDNRLCFCCLTRGHMSSECRSKRKCDKNGCLKSHHFLLHSDRTQTSSVNSILDREGILPVVRVCFRSCNGKTREGNVLIDSGASTTVIRKEFAKSLGLQGKAERFDISVVGGNTVEQSRSRRLQFWISSLSGGEEHCIEAHDIEKTVLSIPPLNRQWLKGFSHLADLDFPHRAGPIDLILGVQYSHLHLDEEVRKGLPFEPVAKKTQLGWYVIGSDNSKKLSSICSIGFVQKIDLEKFYSCEVLGIRAPECKCPIESMSPDDRRTIKLFENSCKLEGDRYVIGLPWKSDPSDLPDNYVLAEKRLISLEKSLVKDKTRAELYNKSIHEYLDNGWAKALTEEQSNIKPVYYLPHHGVYRPEKLSTPLRVVFDPSSVYKGASLNSFLFKGPCLIGNLLGVLLRFREHGVAFMGDISKMYLQIKLPESDTHVHRFLWRDLDNTKQPVVYHLLRVTFGDKPSPDMASYVVLKLADECKADFPEAAEIIRRDRYVDDIIHSCETKEEAEKKMKSLDIVLAKGSFKIKEWFCSEESAERSTDNDDETLCIDESQNKEAEIRLDCEETIKALGVIWNPKRDILRYVVKTFSTGQLTKRKILSHISGIYDPLGLASVITIRARIALQDIWRSNEYDWDDILPIQICDLWASLFQDLQFLSTIEFPRSLKPHRVSGLPQLHVFADASALAYGAAAYLVWPTPNGNSVRLISAKARVAPLKQTTIPRLELMAALIASRLAKTITEEFKEKPAEIYLWTDSQIVLHWLRSDSITLKAFVGVRVSEIQSTWDVKVWKYVPSELNPADDLSRGQTVQNLKPRWLAGPVFLAGPKDAWPTLEKRQVISEDSESKRIEPLIATIDPVKPILNIQDCSSWGKLVRVTSYCYRFITNLRAKKQKGQNSIITGGLQPDEILKGENYWFRMAQFSLGNWQHSCRDLSPFIEDEIVRVGGRLRRSSLPYEQVHPVLLPRSHRVSYLFLKDVHIHMGHVGPERTLCESRRRVWIIRGRNLTRSIVKDCVICRKLRQPAHSTLMADLPIDRLKIFSPPFSTSGVDLFGPFSLRYGRNKSTKAWGAVFTCATTRAIHLEIVDGLSTPAFLHALRRFASYHGWPKTIVSDNGTSFVGTDKELKRMFRESKSQLEDFVSSHRVVWKFNTPLSPHQGGLFESMVKQTKRAIQVAIGQQILSWNEMATVFAEVKSLINSRPIGYIPNSPDDMQPLTPNHFMIGRATSVAPQGPFEETKNLRKRFEFVQMIVNHFWKRFVREYIPTLMKRSKWQSKNRQVTVGDIVLLVDTGVPRGKWNLGKIIDVFPGDDGVIRNVKVKTQSGEYRRSVQKCCIILESVE